MNKTRLWAVVAALVFALTASVAVGCGDDDDDGDGGGGGGADLGLIKEGTLTVGTDTPFPPFEIGQPPNISGYDIDVVDEIAKRIGIKTAYTDTSFDTIFRDTAAGQFDLAVAASTITPERENAVDFSDPYYEAQQALVVSTDSDIASVDDLGGTTVAAQDGTTGETYANDETDASDVSGLPEGPDAINAIRTGQADAAIIDEPVAVDAVEKQGGVEIAETISTDELYGLAMAEDSDTLREEVNSALAEMKEDGTLARLYDKYFGIEPPKSVLEGTNTPK